MHFQGLAYAYSRHVKAIGGCCSPSSLQPFSILMSSWIPLLSSWSCVWQYRTTKWSQFWTKGKKKGQWFRPNKYIQTHAYEDWGMDILNWSWLVVGIGFIKQTDHQLWQTNWWSVNNRFGYGDHTGVYPWPRPTSHVLSLLTLIFIKKNSKRLRNYKHIT